MDAHWRISSSMGFLSDVLKVTRGVFDILDSVGVPGAGIVRASTDFISDLKDDGGKNQLADMVGAVGGLGQDIKFGFDQMNKSFTKVIGNLEAIEMQLAEQKKTVDEILEVVTDLKYREGIEEIEASYKTLMEGANNIKSTLDELKGFIFELNKENAQHLNSQKIREYLELVRSKKGKKAAEELGSYVVTVKAQYLMTVSLYYTYMEDFARVQKEYEDFNVEAMEVIKVAGLADVYEGEHSTDGLKHGHGTFFYCSGARYEGEWKNDLWHGAGKLCFEDGNDWEWYEGKFRCGMMWGEGRLQYATKGTYEGEFQNGKNVCNANKKLAI